MSLKSLSLWLPVCFFIIVAASAVWSQGANPLDLRVIGNLDARLGPGDTMNIAVIVTTEQAGQLRIRTQGDLEIITRDISVERLLQPGSPYTGTITISPEMAECGEHAFKILAELDVNGVLYERNRWVRIAVMPNIQRKPAYIASNLTDICWTECGAFEHELLISPTVSNLKLLTNQTMSEANCEAVGSLLEGQKYTFQVKASLPSENGFQTILSDQVFTTPDNTPPPQVAFIDFEVNRQRQVTLNWSAPNDASSYIERFLIIRKEIASFDDPVHTLSSDAATGDTLTLPYFPLSNLEPFSYLPAMPAPDTALYIDNGKIRIKKIPEFLNGSVFIKSELQDFWNESDSFLSFELHVPAHIYVAVDSRLDRNPEWLSRDFHHLGKRMVTNQPQPNNTRLVLWQSNEIKQPGRVSLGGNFAAGSEPGSSAELMYVVFVKPVEDVLPFNRDEIFFVDSPIPEGLEPENDTKVFKYQISSVDAVGNVSDGVESPPIVIELRNACSPVIQEWFGFENEQGGKFVRGTKNTICVLPADSLAACFGIDVDSLQFQVVRDSVKFFSEHRSEDINMRFFESRWLSADSLCHTFDFLPEGSDLNFVDAHAYYYRVRSKDVHGNISAWSDTVSATQDVFPPGDISNLDANNVIDPDGENGSIRVSWDPAGDTASGVGFYVICRRDESGDFTPIDTIRAVQSTYEDALANIGQNKVVAYRVGSIDNVGNARDCLESNWETSVRALIGPFIAPAPEQLTFCGDSPVGGTNKDTLTVCWDDFDNTGVKGYKVTVAGPNGRLNRIIEEAGATCFPCPLPFGDGIYNIRVRAFYSERDTSTYSNTVTFRRQAGPAIGVINLEARQDTLPTGNIELWWQHPDTSAVAQFQVFWWKKNESAPKEPDTTLDRDQMHWTHEFKNGLSAYQCVNYMVKTIDCFGNVSEGDTVVSQYSNRPPSILCDSVSVGSNSIRFCWQRPDSILDGADQFDTLIEICTVQGTEVQQCSTVIARNNGTCYPFAPPDPMKTYRFRVKEIIFNPPEQTCADSLISGWSEACFVPFMNPPRSVRFEVQAQPVQPPVDIVASTGSAFLSWLNYTSPQVPVDSFLVECISEDSTIKKSEVTDRKETTINNLDISKRYICTVAAIDRFGQHSIGNDTLSFDFKPPWLFTPRTTNFKPECFRDSVAIQWSWLPDTSTFGADSVQVQVSIDSSFNRDDLMIETSWLSPDHGNGSFTFKRENYHFVSSVDSILYARIRARDRFDHVSPWSTEYPALNLPGGLPPFARFDDVPPPRVACEIDSVSTSYFGGADTVDVMIRWEDVTDNCSGTWFYEIFRDEFLIGRDTSRVGIHKFVDHGLEADSSLLLKRWKVFALDSLNNRQNQAEPCGLEFVLTPPDSIWCSDDSTVSWSEIKINLTGELVQYFAEGARTIELFGNTSTNIITNWIDSTSFNFSVDWDTIYWRVKSRAGAYESVWSDTFKCSLNEGIIITSLTNPADEAFPKEFNLLQNYPNPFNPVTVIEYSIPISKPNGTYVIIEIYNILGQKVKTLVDEKKMPGTYRLLWNGKDNKGRVASSGIFIYRMWTHDYVMTRKMIFMR